MSRKSVGKKKSVTDRSSSGEEAAMGLKYMEYQGVAYLKEVLGQLSVISRKSVGAQVDMRQQVTT